MVNCYRLLDKSNTIIGNFGFGIGYLDKSNLGKWKG